jgi:hypothetical protein
MLRRFALTLVPLPFVLAAGGWASARVAERAAEHGVVAVALLAKLARVPASLAPQDDPDVIASDAPLLAGPIAAPETHTKNSAKKTKASATPVIFVSRNVVVGLASSAARPHGAPVPATASRPAGLRLAGVGALGIGLADGDVLTRAVGQPALSTGAVIQAVLAARARHAPVLEGEVWRGTQRFVIRVEQPYLDERRSDATDGDGQGAPANSGAQSG